MTRISFALVLCLVAAPRGVAPAHAAPGIVDPESSSVVIGRRLNAPLVREPFHGGGTSLADLGRRICRVFERTPALDSLMKLSVGEAEFRDVLWREFPQSRPATGLRWDEGWQALHARLVNGNNGALHEFGGRPCEFVRIEAASVVTYRNFRLHHGITLVTRDAAGAEVRHTWLRSVAERQGRFKIYSVRD